MVQRDGDRNNADNTATLKMEVIALYCQHILLAHKKNPGLRNLGVPVKICAPKGKKKKKDPTLMTSQP